MVNANNPLKSILKANDHISIPGVYDALSAKLAELNGFPAAWVSGFCVSTSFFIPDENYLTIDQYVRRVWEIRKISKIPLIVDCDEGYGGIENSRELTRRLSDVGAEAFCLEDNAYPKINSFKNSANRKAPLENADLFANKIAAVKADNPSSLVIARTESLIAGEDLENAVKRAALYQSAGADLLVIHSKSRVISDFEKIARHWGQPSSLVVIPTLAASVRIEDLAALGFKVIILANQLLRGVISSMYDSYNKFKKNPAIDELGNSVVTMDFIFSLIDKHSDIHENV